MIILVAFAFIAGFVTILSPCILPVLPIVLSGGIDKGKRRPLGVVMGFIVSFTFFTLFLSTIVKLTGIPSDLLRTFSVIIILLFGFSLLFTPFQMILEKLFNTLAKFGPKCNTGSGFISGFILGLSLGLIWTPCVGPIIGSVITLAATSTVTLATILITLAYSTGMSIPMLVITYGGRELLQRNPWLLKNTGAIQKAFGILMIATALSILFNFDRTFQSYILRQFPQYGANLTKIEENKTVKQQLSQLQNSPNLMNTSQAPEFELGGTWLNSSPLTMSSLRGKVVLIDFWTYTCINCIRTLPHVTSWYEKYKDKRFVIVGIHTPEFEFEKKTENVKDAISQFRIHYPVLQDNDYFNWNAYGNQYWPTEYLIDAKGVIRRTHFGEGEYDQTEQAIVNLLREAGQTIEKNVLNEVPDQTPRIRTSPETYLGSNRMDRSVSDKQPIPLHSFAFSGTWVIQPEYSITSQNSILQFHFFAGQVNLVMLPSQKNSRVKVFIDDVVVTIDQAGKDVVDGKVTLDKERLYNLINIKGNDKDHILKLEFENDGVQCFAFTFG